GPTWPSGEACSEPNEPGNSLAAALERTRAGGHRGLDRLRRLDDRHRDCTLRGESLGARRLHAAANGQARDGCGPRAPRNPERGLAERRLGVDATLAGDDEIGARELAREVRLRHDELHAGDELERAEVIPDREEA